MIREKIMFWVSIVTLLLAGGIMIVLFVWALFPYNVIDFTLPVTVKNEDRLVERGGTLHLETTYNKHLQVNGHGESFILCEDGNLVTVLPPRAAGVAFPLGEHTFEFDMTVPEKTSLGVCHFESIIQYDVNPIRKVPYTIYTEDFEVTD
jgi:hypothetical protein